VVTVSELALQLRGVTKTYGATTALHKVSLSVSPGTIHGLVGENGAGKSTLGKIVGGIVRPDQGILEVRGRAVSYSTPRNAIEDGIAVMGQEIALVPAMSVLENVFLGAEKHFGTKSAGKARDEVYRELTERVGFRPSPKARVDSLSISEQQRVQILRALARGATILVMDEPTSSQHREELRKLHKVFSELRDNGMTIIYVSHFLDDVIALADNVTILRSGQIVDQVKATETTTDELLRSMLGQRLESVFPQRNRGGKANRPPALDVRDLSQGNTLRHITLDIRHGEIVGLAGLVGSGRTELARVIFGVDTYDHGEVAVNGEKLRRRSTTGAMQVGIAMVPEDRMTQGLLQNLSQEANIALPHLKKLCKAGVVRQRAVKAKALEYATESGVTPLRLASKPETLSGGNQQKVLLAKWLLGEPNVLILDEPTRGVDVGAKSAIYHLIAELADKRGMAVLLISSELEEIVELSDRVFVLHDGAVAATFEGSAINGEAITRAAFGYSETRDGDSDVV
jgi:ABC-type sugar transport system ATPase subunit